MKLLAASAVLAGVIAGASDAQLISRQVYVMGTPATLSTFDADRTAGITRLERLLSSIEATEQQLSTWRPASEVSRVNARAGRGRQRLSTSLCAAFEVLEQWVDATSGAFDPAVGAVTAAWDVHGDGRLPSNDALRLALDRAGWRRIRFDRSRCGVELPDGVSFDVGAWGKGEGLDRARAAVSDDAAPWLIDLGGQVAAQGKRPDGSAWRVAVAHPLRRDEPVLEVSLAGGSLATSAGSERDLSAGGRRVGHILDPRTGFPANFTGSVTVWHERALVADILSTALFVMGPEDGLRWAESRGIAACYLVPDGHRVARRTTPAFTKRLTSSS